MNTPGNDLLLLAGKIITLILQSAMAIGAAALVITLPIVTLFDGDLVKGFADGADLQLETIPTLPFTGMLLILLATVVALFFFFGKLRSIIATVGQGDPFIPANAERLNLMAWLLLGVQLLTLPLAALLIPLAEWAGEIDGVGIKGDFEGLDLTGMLMVLVLFILARVFRLGAAMRADLEGTV